MSDAPRKADRGDVESAVMDCLNDVRALEIVLWQANETPRMPDQAAMLMTEDTFLAWMRMCEHVAASMRTVERLFYEATYEAKQ